MQALNWHLEGTKIGLRAFSQGCLPLEKRTRTKSKICVASMKT